MPDIFWSMSPRELDLYIKGHREKCVRKAFLMRLAFHAKAEDFSTKISEILGEKEIDDISTWSDERV